MAKTFIEVRSSDLSGTQSDSVSTTLFSLDGKAYEIDLMPEEKAEFTAALKVYVAKARRAQTAARTAKKSSGSGMSTDETQAARTWLQFRGHAVADRGRIKNDLWMEWEDAGRPGV